MLLVIRNRKVVAVHTDTQLAEVSDGRYGDAEVTVWDGEKPPVQDTPADPRPEAEKARYAALTALKLSEQDGTMIRVVEDLAALVSKMIEKIETGGLAAKGELALPAEAAAKVADRATQRDALRAQA